MNTYHIHINGLVQGVGFRPFVKKLANAMHINGWVSNTTDGVHIEINANEQNAFLFYYYLMANAPVNALIKHNSITKIKAAHFSSFIIKQSMAKGKPDLLLTPDVAVCNTCKQEIHDVNNKRYQYAFTTCLNCGPRYSIIKQLPYDREHTTMSALQMCTSCNTEYNDIDDRRNFSQTNSCSECSITMHLYKSKQEEYGCNENRIINTLVEK